MSAHLLTDRTTSPQRQAAAELRSLPNGLLRGRHPLIGHQPACLLSV